MRVASIHLYPVKSLRGYEVSQSNVDLIGLSGDRRWLVVDENNRFQTLRELPRMAQIVVKIVPEGLQLSHPDVGSQIVSYPQAGTPRELVTIWRDNVAAAASEKAVSDFLSAVLSKQVRLFYQDNLLSRPADRRYADGNDHVSFADGYPVLLTTTASLLDLQRRLDDPVSMRRFRPNLVIDGSLPWAEDTWRLIRIAGVSYRVVKPCSRCIVTTRDPDTGEQLDPEEPLKTLGAFHRAASGGIIFGQNIVPIETGTVTVGDEVEILISGSSTV